MRLIDADALRARMYHDAFETDSDMQKWDGGCWIRYKMFENAIEDAPTIEPKKGKWIVFSSPNEYHCGLVKCPFCSEELIAEANEYNYCPNCGARMENGDDRN